MLLFTYWDLFELLQLMEQNQRDRSARLKNELVLLDLKEHITRVVTFSDKE